MTSNIRNFIPLSDIDSIINFVFVSPGFIGYEQNRIPKTAKMETYKNQTVCWTVLKPHKVTRRAFCMIYYHCSNDIVVNFYFFKCACELKNVLCVQIWYFSIANFSTNFYSV